MTQDERTNDTILSTEPEVTEPPKKVRLNEEERGRVKSTLIITGVLFLAVIAVFGVGQFLEGNFLTPKLVGENIGLHPVWVMFALLAGGVLLGFLGLMIAVPVAAIIGVLMRYTINNYKKSSLYLED